MSEMQSKAQHITELDFDISAIAKQFIEIEQSIIDQGITLKELAAKNWDFSSVLQKQGDAVVRSSEESANRVATSWANAYKILRGSGDPMAGVSDMLRQNGKRTAIAWTEEMEQEFRTRLPDLKKQLSEWIQWVKPGEGLEFDNMIPHLEELMPETKDIWNSLDVVEHLNERLQAYKSTARQIVETGSLFSSDVDEAERLRAAYESLTGKAQEFHTVRKDSFTSNETDSAKQYSEMYRYLEGCAEKAVTLADTEAKVRIELNQNGEIRKAAITYIDKENRSVQEVYGWYQQLNLLTGESERSFGNLGATVIDDKLARANISAKELVQNAKAFESAYTQTAKSLAQSATYLESTGMGGDRLSEIKSIAKQTENLRNSNFDITEEVLQQMQMLRQQSNDVATLVQQDKDRRSILKAQNVDSLKALAVYEQLSSIDKKLRSGNIMDSDLIAKTAELRKQSEELFKQLQTEGKISDEQREQLGTLTQETTMLRARTSVAENDATSPPKRPSQFGIGGYLSMYAINAAQDGARQIFTTMSDIEFKMMEISRIAGAGFNSAQYENGMFGLAKKYKRDIDEVLEVSHKFIQAGYDAAESISMTESALLALNTAELDAKNSTNSMISIMKQWEMQPEELTSVIDRINKTGDDFAIDSQDLVDGLMRSSSAAKNAKFSFEETIGALTALKEASGRTGREVGTAFNSLIAYLQRDKSLNVFEGMGIKVWADESKQTLVPLLDVLGQLSDKVASGGDEVINMLEKQTDLQNLYTEEVAAAANMQEEYNDLLKAENAVNQEGITDAEKKKLYEQAGTHRRNYLIALLKNYAQIQEVVTNLEDAEGYSMRENARYLDTLRAEYTELITSLKELASVSSENGLMDLAKLALDAATAVAKFSTSTGGAIPTVAALTAAILKLRKNVGVVNLSKDSGLSLFGQSYQDISKDIDRYNLKLSESTIIQAKNIDSTTKNNAQMGSYLTTLNGAKASVGGYTVSMVKAKVATVGLEASSIALNAAIGFGIGFAVTAAVSVISKLASAHQDAIDTANELTQAYRQNTKDFRDSISSLTGLQEEFSALSAGVDAHGKNISLATDQYDRYKAVVEQILEISPSLVKGYDAEGNALFDNNALLDRAIALQEQLADQKRNEYFLSGGDILKGARNELDNLEAAKYDLEAGIREIFFDFAQGDVPVLKFQYQGTFNGLQGFDPQTALTSGEELVKWREVIIGKLHESNTLSESEIQALDTQIGKIQIKAQEISTVNGKVRDYLALWASSDTNEPWYNEIQTGYLDEFSSAVQAIANDHNSSISDMQVATADLGKAFLAIQNQIPVETFDALAEQMRNGTISEKDYLTAVDEIADRLLAASDGSTAYAAAVEAICDAMYEAVPAAESTSSAVNDATNEIAAFVSQYHLAADAVNALQNELSLLDAALQKSTDGQALNTNETLKLIEAMPTLAANLVTTADGYYFEAGALETLRQAKYNDLILTEQSNAVETLTAQITAENSSQFMNLANSLWSATSAAQAHTIAEQMTALALDGTGASAEETKSKIDNLIASWAKISILQGKALTMPTFTSSGGSGSGGGTSAAQKAAQEHTKTLQDESKAAQDSYDKQIKAAQDAAKRISDSYNKRIDKIKEAAQAEIDSLKKVKDERSRDRDRADAQKDIEYWKKRTGVEAFENLNQAMEDLKEKEEDWSLEDQISEIERRRDADIESLEAARDAAKERYDAEIEQLQQSKEAVKEKYDCEIAAAQQAGQEASQAASSAGASGVTAIEQVANYLGKTTQETIAMFERAGVEITDTITMQVVNTVKMINDIMDDTIEEMWKRHHQAMQEEYDMQAAINRGEVDPKTGKSIPKSLTGSEVLRGGLVDVHPAEIIVNPALSDGLRRIIEREQQWAASYNQNIYNNQNNPNDNRRIINFNAPINNVQHQEIRDEADSTFGKNDVIRALDRALSMR